MSVCKRATSCSSCEPPSATAFRLPIHRANPSHSSPRLDHFSTGASSPRNVSQLWYSVATTTPSSPTTSTSSCTRSA
ncbi:hypothetical protein HYQ44_009170 [Verticillium longisporum]|nr:hypothetical protein HYQ44_009170 [Verticillium longisporum]